jgi:hypothetical protein
MAQMAIDKIPPGPKLDALTAEKVFGWKNVHQHDYRDRFYGKRQDKAGYWRELRCPHTRPTSSMRIQSKDEWNSLGGWIDT